MLCFFKKNYTAGFFPLTGNRRRVDGLIPALQAKETVSFDEVKDFFASDSGADVALKNPQWFSIFRSHSRCVTTYRQNRCFLVGDAAHIHSPVGAQGMNTGIQDAYNLAWKLAFFIQGKASAELLDSYEQERRPVALNVIRYTDFAYKLMTSDAKLARFSRLQLAAVLLPLLLKWTNKKNLPCERGCSNGFPELVSVIALIYPMTCLITSFRLMHLSPESACLFFAI